MGKEGELRYNCEKCKGYWQDIIKHWKGIEDEIPYIVLYCPSCKRKELKY